MSTVGFNTVFPKRPSTKFVVKNIAKNNKRIKVFNYPINNLDTRDLLSIPYVSEADIRHSLLKGELKVKIENEELIVIDSDIDLLQFNNDQLLFLQSAGIIEGLQISGTAGQLQLQEIELTGTKNGINTIFYTPEKFLYTTDYKLILYINGVRQKITENFLISESSGPGTGYDTIIILDPPYSNDYLVIDYYKA